MKSVVRGLVVVALAWLACLSIGQAQARAIDVGSCIAPLTAVSAPVSAYAETFDCVTRQNRFGSGNFLVSLRFPAVTATPDDPLVLRMTSLWQDHARIRFVYADGSQATLDFGSRDVSRYMTIGAIWQIPVPWRQAALTGAFVEIRGSANVRGILYGARLMPRSEATSRIIALVALYAGFAGLALALIIYNLSLWTAMRHRFQLIYCAMVAAMLAYTFTSSGLLTIALPWIDNNDRLRINWVLLALSGVAALAFACAFFERGVLGPKVLAWGRRIAFAALGSALALATLAPLAMRVLDRVYYVTMTALLLMIVPIMWSAWSKRSRYAGMFALAWGAPVVVSALRVAHGFNLIGPSMLLDNGNTIALAVEAALSAILMTMRLRELSLERDLALAGEQVARRLASTDPLTGLLNRRAFLEHAVGRRGRFRLLLIDIDHFKQVNDRYGHDAGDQVLRTVAEAIQNCRPSRSLAVRLGGEEFALLLPRAAVGACTAETVLAAVRGQPMPHGACVTVSIGYADGLVVTENDWNRLYRLSDAALYRAKADGRDRACRATDFRVAA